MPAPLRARGSMAPEAARLLPRLHRHARALAGPARGRARTPGTRPPADDGASRADVAAWRALGSAGHEALIQVALGPAPVLPLPPDPRWTAPRWHVARGRFRGAGPLRLRRHVTRLDRDRSGAGAVAVLRELDRDGYAERLLPVLRNLAPSPGAFYWTAALRRYFQGIGARGLELMAPLLADRACSAPGRSVAAAVLRDVAADGPELFDACVAALGRTLDPAYAEEPGDEEVAAVAVTALLQLEARALRPAVASAYARDAVDCLRLPWREVVRRWGAGGGGGPSVLPPERSLPLLCMACGRARPHEVHGYTVSPNVAAESGAASLTPRERSISRRYLGLIVPHPVTCPHCGAVNRYRACPATMDVVFADLEARRDGRPAVHPRSVVANSVTSFGGVHPAVAVRRYRRRLRQHPQDHDAALHLGITCKRCGRWTEAEIALGGLMRAGDAPAGLRREAAFALAVLSAGQGRRALAVQWCRVGLGRAASVRLAPLDGVPPVEGQESPDVALALRRILVAVVDPAVYDRRWCRDLVVLPPPMPSGLLATPPPRPTLGRNDPCPCGSGGKYKRCCGF